MPPLIPAHREIDPRGEPVALRRVSRPWLRSRGRASSGGRWRPATLPETRPALTTLAGVAHDETPLACDGRRGRVESMDVLEEDACAVYWAGGP